jgi:hypothetical protein
MLLRTTFHRSVWRAAGLAFLLMAMPLRAQERPAKRVASIVGEALEE